MMKLKIQFLRIIVAQLILIILIVMDCFGNGKLKAPVNGNSTKILDFSGLSWQVRSGTGNPGGNNWSDSSESVWVDENGILHMTIRKINGVWNCSEIYTDAKIGYGEYRFYVASNVENLDKNVVVGLFTYLNDKNEIDIEFSKWGNAAEDKMGNYATQPARTAGNSHDFQLNLNGSYSTHRFIWKPDRIGYKSWHGHEKVSTENSLIQEWDYLGNDIPIPGDEKLIINLWLYQGKAPDDGNEVEVLIKSVKVCKPPVINNSIVSVAEDIPLFTVVDTLITPGYAPTELDFSIVEGNDLGLFSVSNEGKIILENGIDYEKSDVHLLKILAVIGDMSDTAIVQINVMNVNDNPPTIEDLIINIPENTPVSIEIGTINIFDLDGDSLTFQILSGNENGFYSIDSTGKITLLKELDFEKSKTDTIWINASDGIWSSTGEIVINCMNVNDNAPEVEGFTVTVPEDLPLQSEVGKLIGFDADGDSLTFQILSGNENGFYIVSKDGVVTLEKMLDFESNVFDSVSVQVSDGIFTTNTFFTCFITNVKELSVTALNYYAETLIYPNPATHFVNVYFDVDYPNSFQLLGMDGRKYSMKEISQMENGIQFNVEQLMPGTYLVLLKFKNKTEVVKFRKL